jgi:tetraacyldisaccharide 4'-kinase
LYPDLQLILTDDGLQHYRLARTLELVVLDGRRGWVTAICSWRPAARACQPPGQCGCRGGEWRWARTCPCLQVPRFDMQLQCSVLQSLAQPEQSRAGDFAGQPVIALAGIGHPERFFYLATARLSLQQCLHFPDHHVFTRMICLAATVPSSSPAKMR